MQELLNIFFSRSFHTLKLAVLSVPRFLKVVKDS